MPNSTRSDGNREVFQTFPKLIPEVISGFGVALVSTIMGVFIRVLMMQFRLDIVSRERETRVEIDEAARRLRGEMAQAVQQMKLFSVESIQHAAERETKFVRATDKLVETVGAALSNMSGLFHTELQKTIREQSGAAVDAITQSVKTSSDAALRQMSTSFEEIGRTAQGLSATQVTARSANEQANAALFVQTNTMTDLVGQLSKRIRMAADEVETSGAALARSISATAVKMDESVLEATRRLNSGLMVFEVGSRDALQTAERVVGEMAKRVEEASRRVDVAAEKVSEDKAI